MDTPNFVHEIIQEFSNEDFAAFCLIEDDIFRFPRIEKEDLPQITQGSYQLKQARSYACAHKKAKMTRFGVPFPCFVCPYHIIRRSFASIIAEKNIVQPILVNTSMSSRFRSGKSHESYILADADKNGPDAIIGYYCQCQHGMRTVGCCSHIATTIYYLCYARHHGGIIPIAGHVDDFFQYITIENEDEDDEEQ